MTLDRVENGLFKKYGKQIDVLSEKETKVLQSLAYRLKRSPYEVAKQLDFSYDEVKKILVKLERFKFVRVEEKLRANNIARYYYIYYPEARYFVKTTVEDYPRDAEGGMD